MAGERIVVTPEIKERATHVIAKGKVVYFMHSEVGYTTRHSFYARYAGKGNRPGWDWYKTVEPITLWRDGGIHPLVEGSQILVGPKTAVKKGK